METRYTGSVKWFSAEKGYGFITRDDGEDVFVHYTGIDAEGYRSLEKGQQVEFVVEDGRQGPEAHHVRLAGAEAPSPAPEAEATTEETPAETDEEVA